MTYRQRRLAKAERLQGWADSRIGKAEAAQRAAAEYVENTPLGQPILVGHHSEGRARREQARFNSNMSRSIEHTAKAKEMRSKAANILTAADRAIYADDPDAVQALEAKLAGLEAEREMIRAYNASCRKGTPDPAPLPAKLRSVATSMDRWAVAGRGKHGELPAYVLSNLSGNIGRTRKRLEALRL